VIKDVASILLYRSWLRLVTMVVSVTALHICLIWSTTSNDSRCIEILRRYTAETWLYFERLDYFSSKSV